MLSLPPPALVGPHSPGLGELGSTSKRLQPWPCSSGLWGGCGEPAALRCIPLAPSRQRGHIPAVNGGNAQLGAPTCWGGRAGSSWPCLAFVDAAAVRVFVSPTSTTGALNN